MIAVVLATPQEAAPLLASVRAEPVKNLPFPAYRLKDADGIVMICGMGKAKARESMRQFLDRYSVDEVINIGLGGALTNVVSIRAKFRVSAVCDGDAPDGTPATVCMSSRFANLPAAALATVSKPVFDADRRAMLGPRAMLVDMEGSAIAEVCRDRNTPCCLVKGVSDQADMDGRSNLLNNLPVVSAELADTVIAELGWPRQRVGALKMFARFVRIEHTVFSIPLILAGAWLGAGRAMPPLRELLLLALVGTGARTLGMAVNRILDRDIDALNPRTLGRDLPSGRIRLWGAYAIALSGLAMYLAGCAALQPLCLYLSPVPLIPLLSYSLLKRFTSLCHFGIGLCLALGPAGAFVATSGELPLGPEVLLLTVFTFTWMSAFDIVYALQDIDSDRIHGIHSLPARFGNPRAQVTAAAVHLVSAACIVALWIQLGMRLLSGGAMLVTLGALAAAYWQSLPLRVRFFPVSAIAGVGGALVVLLGGFR